MTRPETFGKNKRKLISFKMLTSHMNVQIKTFLESKTPPIVMICGVFVQNKELISTSFYV